MNGWGSGEEGSQESHRFVSFEWGGEEIGDSAAIQLNTSRVNCAAVEGLKRPVLEVATGRLRFVELPRLELANVERGEDFQRFSVADRSAVLRKQAPVRG